MRVAISTLVLLFGVGATASDKRDDPLPKAAKQELGRLQGEWVLKSGEKSGKKLEANDATLVLEIKGAKWIFTGDEKGEFIAIDSKSDPKCFDLKSVEEGTKGQVHEGIYKIDGNTLTICIHEGKDKQRPIRFETNPQQPHTILAVFERVKKK